MTEFYKQTEDSKNKNDFETFVELTDFETNQFVRQQCENILNFLQVVKKSK